MKGEIDMYYFMDIFYALGINIVKKVCVQYGQTDDTGKKFCKFDEVIGLVQKALKEPEIVGNYHDFVELCKLYDKNENGTMMLAELENILSNLGNFLYTPLIVPSTQLTCNALLLRHILPKTLIFFWQFWN